MIVSLGTWFYKHPYCTDRYIVVSLSSDKFIYCESLWIKASAKCPECKLSECFPGQDVMSESTGTISRKEHWSRNQECSTEEENLQGGGEPTEALAQVGLFVDEDFGRDHVPERHEHLQDVLVPELLGQVVDEQVGPLRSYSVGRKHRGPRHE